jgi:hypothetical protein
MTLSDARYPTRGIELFGGKYKGTFETHDECQAFADGVAAVLNHIVSLPEEPAETLNPKLPKRVQASESNNLSPPTDIRTRGLPPEAIAELAKMFTVRVICN